jgi:hypothetical protein
VKRTKPVGREWANGFAGRFIVYLKKQTLGMTPTNRVPQTPTNRVLQTGDFADSIGTQVSVLRTKSPNLRTDTAVAEVCKHSNLEEEVQSQNLTKTRRAEKTYTEVQNPPPDRTPFREPTQEQWEARKRLLKEQRGEAHG